jgi:hypothetical protein
MRWSMLPVWAYLVILGAGSAALAQSVPPAALPSGTRAVSLPQPAEESWWRPGDRLLVGYSLFTLHRNKNPEHVNRNHLVTLEINSDFDRVWGADKRCSA